MNAVTGLLGANSNTGVASNAPILNPVTSEQASHLYDQNQDALAKQQAFLQAVQAQNGLGNQSSVFNQMQGIANGTGPNPAQAMLNNTTGANVANQAAMMAGQRGAGANVGLMARQAAMQGANTQQQAAGQGAALQAQQSLGALNQMGNIAGQQASNQMGATNALTGATQGEQGVLLGGIHNQNQAQLTAAANQQKYDAERNAMAGNMIGNLTGAIGSGMGMIGKMGGGASGGSGMEGYQGTNSGAAFGSTAGGGDMLGGGAGLATMAAAHGGEVPGPRSNVGKHMHGMMLAQGGAVPAIVSPGERYLNPQAVQQVAKGKADPIKTGEKIPGKAPVKGAKDSYANDIVPKTLESGGIVIPRSITQAKDPHKKAMAFVEAVLAKQGIKKKKA